MITEVDAVVSNYTTLIESIKDEAVREVFQQDFTAIGKLRASLESMQTLWGDI